MVTLALAMQIQPYRANLSPRPEMRKETKTPIPARRRRLTVPLLVSLANLPGVRHYCRRATPTKHGLLRALNHCETLPRMSTTVPTVVTLLEALRPLAIASLSSGILGRPRSFLASNRWWFRSKTIVEVAIQSLTIHRVFSVPHQFQKRKDLLLRCDTMTLQIQHLFRQW